MFSLKGGISVLRLIVHIKGKKIKVLVSDNATILDCKKEVQRVYRSITGTDIIVSLLCDLDQCILCDDYPANLILADRMELVGVAENESLESSLEEYLNVAVSRASCSSNAVTPQHKVTPAPSCHTAPLMDPLNGSYLPTSNNNTSASPFSHVAPSIPDSNAASGANFVDSFCRTPNFSAQPLEIQNAGFKGTAVTPLWKSCSRLETTYSDANTGPLQSSQQAILPVYQSAVSISSAVGGASPEVPSQHHAKALSINRNKMVPSVPEATTTNSMVAQVPPQFAAQKHPSVKDPSNTNIVVEDTYSSDGESSDSTVLEEPLKHFNTASNECKSGRNNSSVRNISDTSKNKRKAESGIELSPKKPKFSQKLSDGSARKSTRDRAQKLTSSLKMSSNDQIKDLPHKKHGQIDQNQSKSRATTRSEKSNSKPSLIKDSSLKDLPESAPQQKQSFSQTSRAATRKPALKRSANEQETKKIPAQKIINNRTCNGKTLSKSNLEESQQLFSSLNGNSSSSEEESVYMSPRHSATTIRSESESDSQSEEDTPRATKNKEAKTNLSTAANTTKEDESPDISSPSVSSDSDGEETEKFSRESLTTKQSVKQSPVTQMQQKKSQVNRNHVFSVGNKTFSSLSNSKRNKS